MRKKSFFLFAVLAMLLCSMSSCDDGFVDYDLDCTVTGKVIDLDTQDPVYGAMVSMEPKYSDVYTGYDGTFEFIDIVAGQYVLKVQKPGYYTEYKNFTIKAGEVKNLTCALRKKE